jgi:4-hydroxybenzoyl-CoA thioesterase
MLEEKFAPPDGAFTRGVTIRFSHCDPAGIVYFPHYFDMFNGVIEDWYTYELGYNYAELVTGSRFGFPFVHLDCDFKIPSRMGEIIDMTLLVEKIGRSSLGIAIVCHLDGLERLRAHMVTAMMSLETRKPEPLPHELRNKIEAYRLKTGT